MLKPDDLDLSYTQWVHFIDEWIFDAIDRQMLKMQLLDGIGVKQIAEDFNLSVDATKTRLRKARRKLFKKLDKYL